MLIINGVWHSVNMFYKQLTPFYQLIKLSISSFDYVKFSTNLIIYSWFFLLHYLCVLHFQRMHCCFTISSVLFYKILHTPLICFMCIVLCIFIFNMHFQFFCYNSSIFSIFRSIISFSIHHFIFNVRVQLLEE